MNLKLNVHGNDHSKVSNGHGNNKQLKGSRKDEIEITINEGKNQQIMDYKGRMQGTYGHEWK